MEPKIEVKPIPRWWRHVPFVGADLSIARYPNIFLPEHMYQNFINNRLSIYEESIMLHENVHIHRQKKIGIKKYILKYISSKKFRLNEELIAIKEQMLFLKQHGLTYDFDRKAKQFASGEYLWVTTFEQGRRMLEGLWSEIDPNTK